METTLKFAYSDDNNIDDVTEVFEAIFRELKIIHSNNMVVHNLDSNKIYFGKSTFFSENDYGTSYNFEAEKRENILSLAKIMIGMSKN